jgi:hypothetical protein
MVQADEPGPAIEVTLRVAFTIFPEGFFVRYDFQNEQDPRRRYYVLSELEAFFLVCDGGKLMRTSTSVSVQSDCAASIVDQSAPKDHKNEIVVRPTISDSGAAIDLTIESPPESAFQIDGKLAVKVSNGDAIYIPARGAFTDGSPRPFVVLITRIRENGRD